MNTHRLCWKKRLTSSKLSKFEISAKNEQKYRLQRRGSLQTLVSALDMYSSDIEFNEEKHFKHFCIVCVLNIVLSFESEDEILKFFPFTLGLLSITFV